MIAAVADPVNQVCRVKGKHNHLGFKKPTALLSLGSVLHCPLSPKLSVNNGSFCRKTLLDVASGFQKSVPFRKYRLAKCQALLLAQAWTRWGSEHDTIMTVVVTQPISSADRTNLYKSLPI